MDEKDEKEKITKVNALNYAIGEVADDIMTGFGLIDELRDNDVVKNMLEGRLNAIF